MGDFNYKGFTYECIIRPWKKENKGRYEFLKWKKGFRNLWQHITKNEYLKAKQLLKK